MSTPFLISYDLNNINLKYDEVFDIIKSFGTYIKLQESFWLVQTNLSPNQMTEKLNEVMDETDHLFICEISDNYQGRATTESWHFINNYIFC